MSDDSEVNELLEYFKSVYILDCDYDVMDYINEVRQRNKDDPSLKS